MEDLKTLTVRALREMARKLLGKGHSRLKTKEDLIAALQGVPAPSKGSARKSSGAPDRGAVPQSERRPASQRAAEERKSKDQAARRPAVAASGTAAESVPEQPREEPPRAPVAVVTFEKSEDGRTPKDRWGALKAPPKKPAEGAMYGGAALGKGAKSLSSSHVSIPQAATQPSPLPPARPSPPRPAPRRAPVREGFFHGRGAPRPHRGAGRAGPRPGALAHAIDPEEELGTLPAAYGREAAHLLVRDPTTLYFFWELSPENQTRALSELVSPRTLLRVFAGQRLLGEEEVALSETGHYLRGLPQGEALRVEVHAVGEGGIGKKLLEASLPDGLPRVGPSPDQSVKFLRVPPDESLAPKKQGAPPPTFSPAPPPPGSLPDPELVDEVAMEPLGSSEAMLSRKNRPGGPGEEDSPPGSEGRRPGRPPLGSSDRVPTRRSPSGQN